MRLGVFGMGGKKKNRFLNQAFAHLDYSTQGSSDQFTPIKTFPLTKVLGNSPNDTSEFPFHAQTFLKHISMISDCVISGRNNVSFIKKVNYLYKCQDTFSSFVFKTYTPLANPNLNHIYIVDVHRIWEISKCFLIVR